ncbi:hypothetical protein BH11BAC4_BH11BAC4_20300 [soil metagenome]
MYKEIIDWIDVILVPLYLALFLFILNIIKKRNKDNILIQKYLIKGFLFKVFCAIFYGLLLQYYYGFGDSLTYFKDAILIQRQIRIGNETFMILLKDNFYGRDVHGIIGMGTEGGWIVEKLALVLSYLSFYRYLVVTLFFSLFAYSGMFKMLVAFNDIMPGWDKQLALIILFFPSMAVYGSGILKDTICMGALGWMLYSSHQLFVKKHIKIKFIFILLLCITIIGFVKVYIIAAFIPSYLFYLILLLIKKIKNGLLRRLILPFLLLITVSMYFVFEDSIDDVLGSYSMEKLFDTVKEQQGIYLTAEDADKGSIFDLGEFEPTLGGFIKKMPAGIVAAIYRPFIWETKKPIMLFSALESLFLLLFTVYVMIKTGFIGFFKQIYKDPFIFLCITYSLLFASLIGLSTFNFGTLTRYRLPLIPFYTCGILAILYNYKKANPGKPSEIQA